MIFINNLHIHPAPLDEAFRAVVLTQLKAILMETTAAVDAINQAAAKLDAANATLGKIAGETTGLKDNVSALQTEVQSLKDIIAGMGAGVSPELEQAIGRVVAAADAVQVSASAVDDLVPDAAPVEPPAAV